MKKRLFLFVLLFTSLIAKAQPPFTRATFDALMNRYAADPVKFLKTETVPDFQFLGNDVRDRAGTITIYDNLAQRSREYEAVRIRAYGLTGIATGLLTHHYTRKLDGSPYSIKELFTYVYVVQNGTWKMASAQHRPYLPPVAEDEAAIRQTVEAETAAFIDADYKTYLSQWAKVPYASFLYAGGLFVGEGLWKKLDEVWANRTPQKRTVTRSNWNLRVNGTSAYVTYNQGQDLGDGKPHDTFESRYLENTSGSWKIVGSNVLLLPN